MDRTLSFFRRAARWLGPALAVLMIGVVVLGSAHHHATLDGHHPCVVCSAAHAPALPGSSAPALSAPVAVAQNLFIPDATPRAHRAVRRVSSRAPPSV